MSSGKVIVKPLDQWGAILTLEGTRQTIYVLAQDFPSLLYSPLSAHHTISKQYVAPLSPPTPLIPLSRHCHTLHRGRQAHARKSVCIASCARTYARTCAFPCTCTPSHAPPRAPSPTLALNTSLKLAPALAPALHSIASGSPLVRLPGPSFRAAVAGSLIAQSWTREVSE